VNPRDRWIWRVCAGFKSLLNRTGVWESRYANSRKPRNAEKFYTVDHGEKNLTIGSRSLVNRDFGISADGGSRCGVHEISMPETPKC